MSTVYVGLINDRIEAFHNKKEVMTTYLQNYKETNPEDIVALCKMKKKDAKNNLHYDEYWLVSYNETYVQAKFEDVLLMSDQEYREKADLLERLYQLLSRMKNKKDQSIIIDTIKIIEFNKRKCGMYTPSISMLNELYWRYEDYKNAMGFYE